MKSTREAVDNIPDPNIGSLPLPDGVLDRGDGAPEKKDKEQIIEEVTPPQNADESAAIAPEEKKSEA